MKQCVDCLRLKKELADKIKQLRRYDELMHQADMNLAGVEATTMERFTVMARIEKEKEILLDRQKGARGGS